MRSQVVGTVPVVGSINCWVYRATKRPSNNGAVTSQCSIGGRYRFAETDWGALGLVLTSRNLSMLHALTRLKAPATSAAYRIFIE